MRARRVITRSGRGIRIKFPSKKLGKQVHCESPLERDAVLQFEMHPLVASYQEQPSEETYYDEFGNARSCYPDFLLRLINGSEVLVEVKRKIDLSRPKISQKAATDRASLFRTGACISHPQRGENPSRAAW